MQRLPLDQPNPGLERTRHQLRATGAKDEIQNPLRSGIHTRGYLPHVKREGASYFVTFRLADSLPKAVLLNFEREKANDFVGYGILKAAARPLTIQRKKLRAILPAKLNGISIKAWALVTYAGQTLPMSWPMQHGTSTKAGMCCTSGSHAESRSRDRLADAESFAK